MQTNENCRGARNRIMILTYITWLTLSLAPAMIAPPERRFSQGQPEMQQAMDNMVTHKAILTKRMTAVSNDGADYHEVLTSKASNLLEEAEKVLSGLPNSKERQWIESFVQRMRAISAMLEETEQNKSLQKDLNSVNGAPVPEGLPLQPTWPATFAVPGINPFQKTNRIVPKFPVTSPELSKVLPAKEYPSERQFVTKPAILSNSEDVEEDALVRELENLHKEYYPQKAEQNPKLLDQARVLTTSSTPLFVESSSAKITNVEEEKAKLKLKLVQEIAEFQRLGGKVPNEVINALHADNQKTAGLAQKQITNVEDTLKFTEAGMVDRQGTQRLSDLNNEDKEISKPNLWNSKSEKNLLYQEEKQIPQMKSNHSFQNIPPNFYPNRKAYPKQFGNYFHYMSSQNKVPYQGGPQNEIPGYQKINSYNQEKYHEIMAPTKQQPGQIPDALKQMLSKPQNNFYNGHLPSNYNEHLIRQNYGPYPYLHNYDPKNSTVHVQHKMPLYLTKQPMDHGINTQLSDEMERQLRDGKIIVLSNSLVRSNFEPNNAEKNTENMSDKPKAKNNDKNVATTEK